MTHPSQDLDDVAHQRHRLGILTVLSEGSRVSFPYLQAALGLSDGNLGRHLQVLAEHDFVTMEKGYEGKKPRTWITLTRTGRHALDAELNALARIIDALRPSQPNISPVSQPATG